VDRLEVVEFWTATKSLSSANLENIIAAIAAIITKMKMIQKLFVARILNGVQKGFFLVESTFFDSLNKSSSSVALISFLLKLILVLGMEKPFSAHKSLTSL